MTSDLTVFNNNHPSSDDCTDFKSCIAIRRLLTSLRYYSSLNVITNDNDQAIFTHFINELYAHKLLIEDFHHLQGHHDDKICEIMDLVINNDLFSECDIDSCDFASRHHRVSHRRNDKQSTTIDFLALSHL